MAAKPDFILRGDDGKLYRVSREQLHARPVPADDPAAKHGSPMSELAGKLKGMSGIHPYACVIAFLDDRAAGSASAKRDE